MSKISPKLKFALIVLANLAAFLTGVVVIAVLNATDTVSSLYFTGFLRYFTMIAAFLFIVIVLVDAYAMFAIKTSTHHSLLLALSVLVCGFLSPDYLALFKLPPDSLNVTLVTLLQYAAFAYFIYRVKVLFNYSYKLNMSLKRSICYNASCVLSFALFAALFFVKLHYIAFMLFMIMPVELSCYVTRNPAINCFNSFSYRPTQFIMFSICGLIAVNVAYSSGFVSAYPFGTTAFYIFTITLIYGFIYVRFVRRTQKSELANANYRASYEHIKSKSLQAQIKPHFVFNVLSSIKNLYHLDTASGDYAMDLFSKHLRAQVEAANTDLIPFENELEHIHIFADLENIRKEKELNIIFDIDYTDFLIPALSLQPFIENAIKYSKINEKEDGFIKISSRYDDNGVLIEISDNGVGFDANAVSDNSYGIRNSMERFRLLTGVTPEIISSPGNGCSVKIRFDKTTLEKLNENNNC